MPKILLSAKVLDGLASARPAKEGGPEIFDVGKGAFYLDRFGVDVA
jgi:hypothetical protein